VSVIIKRVYKNPKAVKMQLARKLDIITLINMRKDLKHKILLIFVIYIFIFITSCMRGNTNPDISTTPEEDSLNTNEDSSATKPAAEDLLSTSETESVVPTTNTSLSVISPDNAIDLKNNAQFSPFFPSIGAISGNREVYALGDLTGVHIYNVSTQEKVMTIDVDLPDCRYGWDAYLVLDHTGEFVSFVTHAGIEVWQVGGGRIFQSPFEHQKKLDPLTCGMDIPQIALSPQGKLLAEYGFGVGGEEYGEYFRVTDVLKNDVVYRWDGDEENVHGQLQSFQTLGFSEGGLVLHTFDPQYFQLGGKNTNDGFLFWRTENWQNIETDSDLVSDSYPPGTFLYTISDSNFLTVLDKSTNKQLLEIEVEGCTREYPCDVIFSPNGARLGILKRSNEIQYKRETLITEIDIYELEQGNKLKTFEILARNKNLIRLKDNGEIIVAQKPETDIATWWTHTAYLNAMLNIGDERIGFTPQVIDIFGDIPHYAGSCQIDPASYSLTCAEGIRQSDGTVLFIEQITGGFVLLDREQPIAQVKYPSGDGSDTWQIRLKGFNKHSGAGYFCLDRNLREETCVVMNFSDNRIVLEQVDLFGFIHSIDQDLSLFINREKKELNIFYEKSNRLVQMSSYQAIAYPIQPALNAEEDRAYYIVQNVENKRLYIEEIALQDAKVVKRFDFGFLSDITPTAIAVNAHTDMIVVGDNTGSIYFLDITSGDLIHSMTVSNFEIVELIFSSNDKHLTAMDMSGKINVIQALQ
jgi:hypothetical protein